MVRRSEQIPVAEWVVRRSSELLGGRRTTRRRFLAGGTVVGSALALHPVDFALRPGSAYDSVCGTDNTCADGYSVFCCTINNGGNFCPEGSFVGGWWQANDSGFCCGAPRYYVDCNADCGSGWQCGCETSPYTCDNRLIACNQFRYGQCNIDIACYGPVVCRVVTCTPPWEFDPSCTSASAADDNTVSHSAPCLPGYCPSPIIMRWSDLGGPGGFLGAQVTSEAEAPAGGGTWVEFQNGAIYDVTPAGLHFVAGALWGKYEGLGGPLGVLGYPTTDQLGTADGQAQYNDFQNDGAIYWTSQYGAWSVHGAIFEKWLGLGAGDSFLGYPITDQLGTPDGLGQYNYFANDGAIYWTPRLGAWSIFGIIKDKWASLDWEQGVLGYPVTDQHGTSDGIGQYNHFAKLTASGVVDRGSIFWTPQFGPWSIHGAIREKWKRLGWEGGVLGYPTTDQEQTPDGIGQYNHFVKLTDQGVVDRGSIFWTELFGAWSIHGAIRAKWKSLGWEQGVLGYPVTDQRTTPDGLGRYNLFKKPKDGSVVSLGGIYDTAAHGVHAVYGKIFDMWTSRGREAGSLGYPVADQRSTKVGSGVLVFQKFEHGTLYVD